MVRPLQNLEIGLFVVPVTVSPRILLAFTALDIAAELIGTLATAIGTDHFATSSLIPCGALKEC